MDLVAIGFTFILISNGLVYSHCNSLSIEQVAGPFLHSEGPHWDAELKVLYFVDIAGFAIHRYDPNKPQLTSLIMNDTVSVIVPLADYRGNYLIGLGRAIAKLTWNNSSPSHLLEIMYQVDKDKPGNRFNDGKADTKGNLWIGTMGEEKPIGNVKMNQGSLFKLGTTCKLSKKVSPVSISNGIAWNRENNLMYYIDSPTRKIDTFHYDIHNGEITNRKTFFDFEKNNLSGVPDGMTIDTDDNLWVACWGGSKVIQICGMNGKLLRSIELPVERVTSVAFGGNDISTLYVTTMKTGLSPEQLKKQPAAGSLFAIKGLNVTGLRANKVSIDCLK